MQKQFRFLILAAIFLTVLSPAACAQYEIRDEYTAPTDETHSVDGVVTKMLLKGSGASITVQTESGAMQNFHADNNAAIFRHGEPAALNQIQPGDSVRLRLSKKSTVKSVEIL